MTNSRLTDALSLLAKAPNPPSEIPATFNSHIHLPPNFSAFTSATDAVEMAAAEGCALLGTSNYYDFSIYAPFIEGCLKHGIAPVLGIEIVFRDEKLAAEGVRINDPGNPGKGYLCGKGINRLAPFTPRATELIAKIREGDSARMETMATRLGDVYASQGLPSADASAVRAAVAARAGVGVDSVVLQERHLAEAYQVLLFEAVSVDRRSATCEALFGTAAKSAPDDGVGLQNEIRTHLMKAGKPAFVDEQFVTFAEAYELIVELGGMPCYPIVADGMNPMSEFERDPDELVQRLQEWKIGSVEFIANRNSPDTMQRYSDVFAKAGIQISVGTEHNTLDRIPIQPSCKGGQPIPPSVLERCWQGSLLAWNHQQALLKG